MKAIGTSLSLAVAVTALSLGTTVEAAPQPVIPWSRAAAPAYCEVKHGQVINHPPSWYGVCYGNILVYRFLPWPGW